MSEIRVPMFGVATVRSDGNARHCAMRQALMCLMP